MSKQVYFVVYVNENGEAVIDDERAVAVFHGDDIWIEGEPEYPEGDGWVNIYDEAKAYEDAQEVLQNLLIPSWKERKTTCDHASTVIHDDNGENTCLVCGESNV